MKFSNSFIESITNSFFVKQDETWHFISPDFITIDEDGSVTLKGKIQEEPLKRNNNIKDVIFNEPATIVFWKDGTKTIVKCKKTDYWDKEKGLAMAICKKYFGNKGNFNDIFKKYVDEND